MKILFMGCSPTGYGLMKQLKNQWNGLHPLDEVLLRVKTSQEVDAPLEELLQGSMKDCVGAFFSTVDAILFVGASGIAIRCIAPFLVHKSKDPAVIVMDETGKFCISLLSGHIGGANELTKELALLTGAIPVVTTATDREGKPAIDVFAKHNHLVIMNWEKAKDLSAEVLTGKKIVFRADLPQKASLQLIAGRYEKDVLLSESELEGDAGENTKVLISPYNRKKEIEETGELWLVPQWIYAGIGCKKGISEERIEAAVRQACIDAGLSFQALRAVGSIDLKKEEAGLVAFCEKEKLSFETYSGEELMQLPGEFSASAFVASVTGVDNVCERSAVRLSGGDLIFPKHAYEGVTVAFAFQMEELHFE